MINIPLYKKKALDMFRTYSDKDLETYLCVSLQHLWAESGESEQDYEHLLLRLIEKKLQQEAAHE